MNQYTFGFVRFVQFTEGNEMYKKCFHGSQKYKNRANMKLKTC